MHASLAASRKRPVSTLTSTLRSNAIGVSRVIRNARGSVAVARRKWRLDTRKVHDLVKHLHSDLQNTQHQVEAEVGEFIQSPHLLFQPIRLALTLALPMTVPLFFMPTRILLAYILSVFAWYLICLLIFATEVAMRPPWYKKGLPSEGLPPYYKGFVHNPLADLNTEYEDVQFHSPSGALLRAWYIPAKIPSKTSVVFVHGVGRDRRAFLRHTAHFLEAQYSCLLFDLSEHGLSDGVTPGQSRGTAFGAREQYDVTAAVNYLKSRGAAHVAIVGTSCGASSAILAAASNPGLASCVIAENPFTRADDLFRHHLHILSENYLSQNSHQTVRRAVFWLAGKLLMMRMGYFLKPFGAIDVAPQLTCPLLVAHSTEDDIVPFQHGLAIYEAARASKQDLPHMVHFQKFSDAAHCALYDKDPELWTSTVLPFVESAFVREERCAAVPQ